MDRWLAGRYWPGESALGNRMMQGVREVEEGDELEWRTIVGVVGEVRMAELGEGGQTAQGILSLVLGRSARVTGIGLAAGLAGALLLTRSMTGLLYGVQAADPTVFGLVALVLATVALAASLGPARRATRVDPAVVLTSE